MAFPNLQKTHELIAKLTKTKSHDSLNEWLKLSEAIIEKLPMEFQDVITGYVHSHRDLLETDRLTRLRRHA